MEEGDLVRGDLNRNEQLHVAEIQIILKHSGGIDCGDTAETGYIKGEAKRRTILFQATTTKNT